MPAPIWRRLAAMFYDGILLLGLFLLLTAIVTIVNADSSGQAQAISNAQRWIYFPFLFAVTVFYYWLVLRKTGQTLGMKAWKIKVIRLDEKPISLIDCVLRCAAGLISLVPLCTLGYWLAQFTKRQQSLPDWVSRTLTVLQD